MSDKYFSIFEALTWIAFGEAFDEELFIEDLPTYEIPGWHGKESMKEFYCRQWGMSPENYDARFIDFGLTKEEAKAKINEAEKELIEALSDRHSNIRMEGKEDELANGIPKEIPPNYFRAKITLQIGGGEVGADLSALEDMFPGPHVRRTEIPSWYGAEIEKEAIMKRWPRGEEHNAVRQSVEDWLAAKMRGGPKEKTKEEYFDEAISLGHTVPRRRFDRIWANLAAQYPKYKWDKSGRIKGKS